MPGLQTDPAECDTIVAGVVITPKPTPVAAPTVVAGTQVSSQPLPVTGADTRGMAAAGILLILGGAALALAGLGGGALLNGYCRRRQLSSATGRVVAWRATPTAGHTSTKRPTKGHA